MWQSNMFERFVYITLTNGNGQIPALFRINIWTSFKKTNSLNLIRCVSFLDIVQNMGTNSSSSCLFGGSSNQSPVSGTPIQLSNCVNQPITSTTSTVIQQQNNGQLQQHSTYVDQRVRSQLIKPATPARELPVWF